MLLSKKKKKQKVKQFLEIFAQKLDTASKKRSNMPVYLIWSVKHTKSAQKERLFFLFVFIFATCFWQSIDRPDTVILAGVDCVTDSPQVCSCEGLFAYNLWGRVTSRVHQRRNVVIKVTWNERRNRKEKSKLMYKEDKRVERWPRWK